MNKEIKTLRENNTWTLVPRPEGKKILTSRWVFKIKRAQNGKVEKYKARLVARGHTQQKGIDYEEVFAPVARYESIRALLAASVNEEMYVDQMDVISAYVQGELSDEIYMEQPEMFIEENQEDMVCKLKKPLYGLKQSGREWYRKLDNFLLSHGGRRTEADPCIYTFNDNKSRVILIVYVDDIIVASKERNELIKIKKNLQSTFKMVDLGPINHILGIDVKREGLTGKLHLSQERYVKSLIEKFYLNDAKSVATPLEANIKISRDLGPHNDEERIEMQKKPYRELVGGLIYLANATRPDIAFAANALSRFCTDPGTSHWLLAKRVLKYLKDTSHYGITYTKSEDKLQAFTDSDWAGNVDDRKSCTGNVIMLAGGPISWRSKKQASVALSTMEAEYAALAEVSKEVVYLKRLLNYIGFEKYVEFPIHIYCDNQSAIELSKNAVLHKRSKHIDISFHFTRELVEKKEIKVTYLRTDQMLADILTKPLPKIKHQRCVRMLNLE